MDFIFKYINNIINPQDEYYVPDRYKTQEMCLKVIEVSSHFNQELEKLKK